VSISPTAGEVSISGSGQLYRSVEDVLFSPQRMDAADVVKRAQKAATK
jgi:hypothetical protein